MKASEIEFERLFRAEFPSVMRTVFLICHDRELAHDITQEAFVQLFRHWRKVSTYDRPGAWVRRVAIRQTFHALRREQLRISRERDVTPPALPGSIDVDLLRAIGSLPPRQRATIVLFYFEDRPLAEVADIMGCSHATARVHAQRARARLAELLGEEARDDVP